MENLIVVTFKDVQDANAGLSKMKELDQLDDIVIYNMVMVRKEGEHLFDYLYDYGPETQDLPAEGALIGSVIGLIAGPVGMAIGMMTGVVAGAIGADDTDDFTDAISDRVNDQLRTGEYAIIADVEEDIELLIDSSLGGYNATIVRTSLADASDLYDLQQWNELDKEIDDAQKELDAATEAQKASIKEKLAKLKAKREERNTTFKAKVENMRNKMHDKMKSLNQKIAAANGQRKEKLKAYNEKVKAKLDKWNKNAASVLA